MNYFVIPQFKRLSLCVYSVQEPIRCQLRFDSIRIFVEYVLHQEQCIDDAGL